MTLRLPLSGNKHATIVSAYAPTMTNPDEVKDKFYDDLDNIISATPRTDKLILLGDFNARVGTDHQTWEGVIGSEGVGNCNSIGLLLLRQCAEHWFDENDEEIKLLLEEKHCLHKAHQDDTSSVSKKAAYNNICKSVQNKLRDLQDSWLSKKAEEIQSFADRKDMKKFHDALKTIYGPKSSGATPLLSADGSTLLTDKDAILKRWAEHFNSVLN